MNPTLRLILSGVMWLALLAYIIFAVRMCSDKQKKTLITDIKITVTDQKKIDIVSPEIIEEWLEKSGHDLNNIELQKINTQKIKEYIESHSLIRRAKVYTDNVNGVLHIDVAQRRPIARFNTYNDHNFYLTDDNWVIPIISGSPHYVPIITGTVELPFEHGYQGSIELFGQGKEEEERKTKEQFYFRLDSVKRVRSELRTKERAAISEQSKERRRIEKKRNENDKEILLNALTKKGEERRALYSQEVKRLNGVEQQIVGKEQRRLIVQKKEQQNYLYLLKLINFVDKVRKSSFWDAQIVQINVKPQKKGDAKDGAVRWIEPDVELIPRVGKHIVVLGTLDDVDEKLDKLTLFYNNVLNYDGWDRYHTINLKYKGQIVCRERKFEGESRAR